MAMIGSPNLTLPNTSQGFQTNRPNFQPLDMEPLKPLPIPGLFNPLLQNNTLPPSQTFQRSNSLPSPSLAPFPTRTPFTPITNTYARPQFSPSTPGFSTSLPSWPGNGLSTTTQSQAPTFKPTPAMTSPFNQPYRPFIPPSPVTGQAASPLGALGQATPPSATGALGAQATPAQQTGQKIGQMVTTLLEENPALQEKVDSIDLDALSENIGPKLETVRASVQQAIKPIPKMVDKKLIRLFDTPQAQELATQFDDWLRKPPEPTALPGEAGRPGSNRPGAGNTNIEPLEEEDPFAEEAPMKEPPPKKSMLGKLKEKVWPFNKQDKENRSPALEERIPARKRKPSEMSDADLEALLNESFGQPTRRPTRQRPMAEDEGF